jgi:hypothetical protein
MTAGKIVPCPFCGDPMEWDQGRTAFFHTASATDVVPEESRCALRHMFYHADQLPWWNTRTDEAATITSLTAEVERLKAALRRIAEGNLGDTPWQANYESIRKVALAAIQPTDTE